VHHGGASTVASALRAGVPQVIVPYGGDQFALGPWVQSLGVGLAANPLYLMDGDQLAVVLIQVIFNSGIKEKAKALGDFLRQEDGVPGALKVVEDTIAQARSGNTQELWEAERVRALQNKNEGKKKEFLGQALFNRLKFLVKKFGYLMSSEVGCLIQLFAVDKGPESYFVVDLRYGTVGDVRMGQETSPQCIVHMLDVDMWLASERRADRWLTANWYACSTECAVRFTASFISRMSIPMDS